MRAWRRTSGRGCCWASSAARASPRAARALLLALLVACAERPSAPVTAIRVTETVRSPEGAVDRAQVEQWTGAALSRIDGLAVRSAQPGDRRWQAAVKLGRRVHRGARPEDGGVIPPDRVYREVEVVIELRAIDPPQKTIGGRLARGRYEGLGRVAENVGVFDDDRALVERAVDAAAADLAVVIELEVLPEAEVVARIGRGTTLERTRAIEAAGARKLMTAVPALVALVPDRGVGAQATGALVALGDPRAAEALIESARDRPLMSVIYAVAQLGGKQAEGWLFTLSSGHRDADVRAAAQEALGELERRRARGTVTATRAR